MKRTLLAALAVVAMTTGMLPVAAATASATQPSLPSVQDTAIDPDSSTSWVYDLNNRNEVIGGHSTGNEIHGYLWRHGTVTDLGTLPGGNYSLATGINQAGDIVGNSGNYSSGPFHAVLWHHGTMTDLGTLGGNSSAGAINDRGVIVGNSQAQPSGPFRVVLWRHGVMTVLPTLDGSTYDLAGGPNKRGELAGYSVLATGIHAVLWTGGRTVDLGPGQAIGLDDQGQVLIESVDAQGHQYRYIWDHGHRLALPAGVTDIAGLTQDGVVFGMYQPTGSATQHGFLWNHGRLVDLGNFSPSALNGHGQIVGGIPNGGGAAVWYHGRVTMLLPVAGRGDARPMLINDSGLVAGFTGLDTATVWSVPPRG